MRGSERGLLNHPRNPYAALLFLGKEPQAVTACQEGGSPVFLLKPRPSCPARCFDAATPTPDHTSCFESGGRKRDRALMMSSASRVRQKNIAGFNLVNWCKFFE